jgi:hypothetical protein
MGMKHHTAAAAAAGAAAAAATRLARALVLAQLFWVRHALTGLQTGGIAWTMPRKGKAKEASRTRIIIHVVCSQQNSSHSRLGEHRA